MWINNQELRDLLRRALAGEVTKFEVDSYEQNIRRAEEREKVRRKVKFLNRVDFYDKVWRELNESAELLSPTDLQFRLYKRTGEQYSCSKLSKALFRMRQFDYFYYNELSEFPDLAYLKGKYDGVKEVCVKKNRVYYGIVR